MFQEVCIETSKRTVRIHQSLGIFPFQVRLVNLICQPVGFRQQGIVHHGIHPNGIHPICFRNHSPMSATSQTSRNHQQAYAHHPSHPFRQSEIETATLSYPAIYPETAHPEKLIRLTVFLDDALAIHQSESASLALLQSLGIRCRLHPYLTRIVHLFVQDTSHILFRKSRSIVLYGYFYIIRLLTGIDLYLSPLLGVLPGILHQRIHHEESQRLVRLYPSLGRFHRKRLLLPLEIPPPFLQDLEQRIQGKVLDIQAQRTLTHLDPQRQNVIVFVDALNQLTDVLIFSLLDVLPRKIIEGRELMHLVHHPIYIRCNACHQEETRFLDEILPFVLHQVLLMHILFLLQPPAFVSQQNHRQAILQSPRKVRNHHFQQCPVFLLHARGHFDFPNTDDLPFRIPQQELILLRTHLLVLFLHRTNLHVRCTHQRHQFILHRCHDGRYHILQLLGIRRHRSRYLPGNVQRVLQPSYVMRIANAPTTIQVNH